MSSVAPSPTPSGNTGPASKVVAWTSFVADHRTSKVYSVANGGHGDYSGNEVDALDLERDQPVWSEILPPTPNAQVVGNADYYADGRPTSRHTYYGVTLNEFDDRIMLFAGIRYGSGSWSNKIDSYNIGANNYSPGGTHPNLPFPGTFSTALNPFTGDVYLNWAGDLWRWNRSSNTVANLNPIGSGPTGGDGTPAAFDTSRDRILYLGNNDRHTYALSTNAWTQITPSGANASSVSGAQKGAMVYVPAIDRFLVRLAGAGNTVYQVDPATFEVTTFATTGGSSIPSTSAGPYNKFLYVPRLGGAVYVPAYNGNAWFLRLH